MHQLCQIVTVNEFIIKIKNNKINTETYRCCLKTQKFIDLEIQKSLPKTFIRVLNRPFPSSV